MRIRSVLASAAVTATSLLVIAAPAQAQPDGKCEYSNIVCLYENKSFNAGDGTSNDHWIDFSINISDFRDYNWRNYKYEDSGDGIDNEVSSVKFTSSIRCFYLYQNVGYSGAASLFISPISKGDLSGTAIGDNRASSLKFISC
ncbi:hypothetical protein FAF44_33120 [Nonomuraea sp. MG754425]|uniref:hypothetical protein n=1 Tax=Nonomuraea sp. MG754425 TaxID=2570319 RepID=UPI001F158E87|nr:hypothetical protein [Nonomuraea sp. MG754425]MCF6473193.1 hypothetical protein [Nonomuraea sp. MG754425]